MERTAHVPEICQPLLGTPRFSRRVCIPFGPTGLRTDPGRCPMRGKMQFAMSQETYGAKAKSITNFVTCVETPRATVFCKSLHLGA